MHDDRRARMQRGRRLNIQAADMKHRQVGEDDVVAGHVVHRDGVHRIEGHRILREDRALRASRGPRCIDDQQRVFGTSGEIERIRRRGGDEVFEFIARRHDPATFKRCNDRRCALRKLVLAEQNLRP